MIVRRLMTAIAVASFAFGSAVAGIAWHGRETVDDWRFGTPTRWTLVTVSPWLFDVTTFRKAEGDIVEADTVWRRGDYDLQHDSFSLASQPVSRSDMNKAASFWSWHDLGWIRGFNFANIPSYTRLWLPTWLVVVPTILPLPVLITLRSRRRCRGQDGCCRKCGYDLRGTPGRCPECGTVPAPAAG